MEQFKQLQLSGANRTIWIFGAGASSPKPYSVPAQQNMLKEFFTRGFPGQDARQQTIANLKEQAKSDCKFVLPGADPESVSLEEVFSAYEIMLSEPRTPEDVRITAREALERLKRAIQYSTYTFGRGDSKKWRPHNRGSVRSPYAELLEKLHPQGNNIGVKAHAFVTFNYDINLDRCLINLKGVTGVDIDYGIPMANERTPSSPAWKNPNNGNSSLLLRTHGALNWIRCDACYSLFTTVSSHANVTDASRCWACGSENIDYVLVHPSYLREYTDPIIQLIWGRCQEELVLSDRWVFIGYSLPLADVHFRELLRHCHRSRVKAEKETDIVLIGRKQKDGSIINKSVYASYHSLFGRDIRVWEATDGGFSDFPSHITP